MIYLRDAEKKDVDLIFRWANDPMTRQNSFNSETIDYDEHVRWYDQITAGVDVRMFILMDNDSAIGQIRIQINNSDGEISYSIAPEYRGRGYGTIIVDMLVEKVRKEMPEIKKLTAEVKPNNTASKMIFEKENFMEKSVCYELNL